MEKDSAKTIRYDQVNAMLINEFLQEYKKVEEQQSTITQLKNNFHVASAEQQKEIELLTAQVKEQFFFSSRRRHTRCLSDWSSDVCSSDLGVVPRGTTPVQLATCAE